MDARSLSILALSPYHGGPRRQFLEGLAAHSRHSLFTLTLPPRTWPWRLRGSALHFAAEIARLKRKADVILADDLVDVARLRALLPPPWRTVPVLQYFHDDMLGTDLKDHPRDEPLALAQLYSLLACDRALVASRHHRDCLLDAVRRLIDSFPDAVPARLADAAAQKLLVLPHGVDVAAIHAAEPCHVPPGPPIILWNNPWADSQNPQLFFETLYHLDEEGIAFRLIAVGAAVRKYPAIFQEARRRFGSRVLQFGYLPDRDRYLACIRAADIVVNTALREWFPLATIEAAIAGAAPVVSRQLANPEVFGDALSHVSYRGPVDLRRRLARLLTRPAERRLATSLRQSLAARFDWSRVAASFDRAAQDVIGPPSAI
jgi:glycosyltransferase involved in cell wall biosynthesis